jgi:predicted NACHT family NTPase
VSQDRVTGLEAVKKYSKLIVLGKPGAGKQRFEACGNSVQCGELQPNRVPILSRSKTLRKSNSDRAYSNTSGTASYGVNDPSLAEKILLQGQALVLLDGLDEVRETDCYRVLQEVRNFSTQFHANRFIITCRIATREYTLEQFTEVEVADFDEEQIAAFATKWFATQEQTKGYKFIQNSKQTARFRN